MRRHVDVLHCKLTLEPAVVLIGLGAGAFLVGQRPSFRIEFGARLAKALLPLAWRYVSKRMPPEEEAAWREAERRGAGG